MLQTFDDHITLYVDERERVMKTYMDIDALREVRVCWTTLPIGDYVLCRNDLPLCIVERKTWADLNASIVDGRSKNHDALCAMSTKWGTPIVYMMEGAYTDKYRRCRTFLYNRIWKDKVHVLTSRSPTDTLSVLIHFASCVPKEWTCTGDASEFIEEMKRIRGKCSVSDTTRMWMALPKVGLTTAIRLHQTVSLMTFLTSESNPIPDIWTDERWNHACVWLKSNEHEMWRQVKGISKPYALELQRIRLLEHMLTARDNTSLPLRHKNMYTKLYSLVSSVADA